MTSISQSAIKSGFFVISGRNTGEIEDEFDTNLKKQSQSPAFGRKSEARSPPAFAGVNSSP
jgi:hypothetical protein